MIFIDCYNEKIGFSRYSRGDILEKIEPANTKTHILYLVSCIYEISFVIRSFTLFSYPRIGKHRITRVDCIDILISIEKYQIRQTAFIQSSELQP